MSIKVDKKHHYKTINKTCQTANIIYLILRVFYLVLFLVAKLYIIAGITAGTVVIYALFFLLVKHKKYYQYALLCGNEFFAYITATTLMLGFDTGFHFYLIGLCVVSFFTSYFSKKNQIRNSIIWVGLSVAIYLTIYLVSEFNKPYYPIDSWLRMTLFITNAIVVFAFVASYLVVFLNYALKLEKRIINESRTDELTQICNRYGFYDYFEDIEDMENAVVALFDIDDFKSVNDHYGHAAGDQVLKRIAELTIEGLSDEFVCRYGGEEFVVVLKKDGKTTIMERLEALRKRIEKEQFEFEGEPIHITITIGAVNYSEGMTLEEWVMAADEKMYTGKHSGKNRTVYSPKKNKKTSKK
ncbi:MAG: GGDEF domain-containing protein [Bacilli bacterium]|nr:GGDEF domain-containing protein [Bacilli bacterium]